MAILSNFDSWAANCVTAPHLAVRYGVWWAEKRIVLCDARTCTDAAFEPHTREGV